MSRKNESVTLSIPPWAKTALEAKAKKYGYMWGDRPNISALLVAIACEAIPLGETTPELKLRAEIRQLEAELKEKKAQL